MPLSNLLPRQRVNLLSGVRDAGKTRFIIPAMVGWRAAGGPPWAYVAADRSILDAQQTILDMNYKLTDVPLVPAYGRAHKASWRDVVAALVPLNPRPEVVVVEAFQDFAESLNKRNLVHAFMNEVDTYCQPTKEFPNGLTIVGNTGAPKQGPRDRYPDPTQRIPGTAIWGERASAVIVIESADKDLSLVKPERVMYFCRKHGGLRLQLNGWFDADNRLVFPTL